MKLLRLTPIVLLACASAPPAVAVEPRTVPRIEAVDPPAPAIVPPSDPMPSSCERGFVEVHDGTQVVRYELGREIVAGTRGAKHAFAERVIHKTGEVVFHLEGIAKPDSYDGHLSISLTGFREPAAFPAVYGMGQVSFQSPDRAAVPAEKHGWTRIELTSFGEVGDWVAGTFSSDVVEGRFRVCRTADWKVRI